MTLGSRSHGRSVLEWGLLPLNVGSVVATRRENVGVFLIFVVESYSWNVLRVTCHSSALLGILEDWESVDADGAEIIACYYVLPVFGGIDSVDISSVCSLREDSRDLPTEFASGCLPQSRVNQGGLTVWHLLALFDVVEDLGVGLIDSSQELGVS